MTPTDPAIVPILLGIFLVFICVAAIIEYIFGKDF